MQDDVSEVRENVQRMEGQMSSMFQMVEHMCRLMIDKDKQKQKQLKRQPDAKSEFRKGKCRCIIL